MKKILIIYGPRGGFTEQVADSLKSQFSRKFDTKSLPGSMVTSSTFREFDLIIFGIATLGQDSWNAGRQDIDVNQIQVIINKFDFTGKRVAIFGLGNSILYPEHFCDDMGIMEEILQEKNVSIIGYTSTYGYEFENSKALRNDKFCGLALDNDTEHEKTESRITAWVDAITTVLEK
ncbi:MAG: flavodoxin domain-containing protein [Bacteroidota bacterium]